MVRYASDIPSYHAPARLGAPAPVASRVAEALRPLATYPVMDRAYFETNARQDYCAAEAAVAGRMVAKSEAWFRAANGEPMRICEYVARLGRTYGVGGSENLRKLGACLEKWREIAGFAFKK